MKKIVKYTDNAELGEFMIVKDALPRPEELVFREDTTKVTIALTKRSVEFFKEYAKKNSIQYQRLIRGILDDFARTYRTTL